MSRPTARVLALLELLQAGGLRIVTELADRLQVDERTIRRYVEHLVELEIPVQSVRGRYGGYRLAAGYRVPPLMLADDEAVAVAFGLVAAGRTGLGPADAVASAAAKLRRLLPATLGRRLEILLADLPPADAETDADAAAGTRALLLLAAAARDQRAVAFDYIDRTGRTEARTVSPYGVVSHSRRWYLVGRDEQRAELRNFRLDRITRPAESDHRFVPAPGDLDPAALLAAGLAAVPWRYQVTVRLPAGDWLGRFPPGTTAAGAGGDELQVSFRVERLDWVPGFLLGLGAPFAIEAPDVLCALSRLFARRLGDAAG